MPAFDALFMTLNEMQAASVTKFVYTMDASLRLKMVNF
jgi:hypothetical protein